MVPIEIVDHFPFAIGLRLDAPSVNINNKTRVFKHDNNVRFTRLLTTLIPEIVDQSMDTTFEVYDGNLFRIYEESYPVVRRAVMHIRTENSEWLSPGIKACIKKKSKLYRMYIRGSIIKESYTFYANKLTALLNRAKRLYYYKIFSLLVTQKTVVRHGYI